MKNAAYSVGDSVSGTVSRIVKGHVTLTIEGTKGRLPIADLRAVDRRASPKPGDTIMATVRGKHKGRLVLGFSV